MSVTMSLVQRYTTKLSVLTLTVDPSYQRVLNIPWVRKKAKEFNEALLGVVVVSQRSDGRRLIMDGQQRVGIIKTVMELRGLPDFEIDCLVHVGLTPSEEAEMFLGLNDDKAVQPGDIFRARITAGYPDALDIQRIVNDLGLVIDYRSPSNPLAVRAISSVQHIYNNSGGDGLRETLLMARMAWPNEAAGMSGDLILGIGMFIAKHRSMDPDRLLTTLKKVTPVRLLQQARADRDIIGGSTGACVAVNIARLYNKGLRSRQVEVLEPRGYGRDWKGHPPRPSHRSGGIHE